MWRNYRLIFTHSLCLCLLSVVGGCGPTVMYERVVQLSAPMQQSASLAARTHNGSISINGADVVECNLTATITARAATEDQARKLAERTKIRLEPVGKGLKASVKKPNLASNQSISVDFDITLPKHANLELTTHNGAVKIADITGAVTGSTHNGGITVSKVFGNLNLQTHNGSIKSRDISGDARLETHNCIIKAYYSKPDSSAGNVSIVTHNGGIDFVAPPDFSAAVDIKTHNGSIKTDLPIQVIGEVNKRKLTGTIGTGQAKLHLETHNGSISIK